MGQVFVTFSVENSADTDRAGRAEIPADAVRRVELPGVLMDSGATHLCLPAEVIAALGLPFSWEAEVRTATGIATRRIFRNVIVRFEDRQTQVECIELPTGMPPLLGALPMEGLGIEPDLQTRKPRKLPKTGVSSYVTA